MSPEEFPAHSVTLPSLVGEGSVKRKLRASLESLLEKGSGPEGLSAKLLRARSRLLHLLDGGKVPAQSSLSAPPLLTSLKSGLLTDLGGLEKSLSYRFG